MMETIWGPPPMPPHSPGEHADNGHMTEVGLNDLLTILTAAEARMTELAHEATKTIDRRHLMKEYDAVVAATTRIRKQIREGF